MKMSPPRRQLTKILFFLVINVVSLVVIMLVGETYLRIQGYKPYTRSWPGKHSSEKPAPWAQPDSSLGWTNQPEFKRGEINEQGFRDRRDFDKIDLRSDKKRIMLLGDSFIFGVHASIDQTIPSILEAKFGDRYEACNLGVPGWGIDQMYLAFLGFSDRIQPHIVILAFIDDDIERVLEAHRRWESLDKPVLTVVNGELVARQRATGCQLFLDRIVTRSVLVSQMLKQFYLLTEAKPVVRQIFRNIAAQTNSEGQHFVVVRIPTRNDRKLIRRVWRRINNFEGDLESRDVLWLEPSERLVQMPNWEVSCYREDGHLNQLGYQLVSSYVYARLKEKSF